MKSCNQCGKCCIKYGEGGLSASAKEVELWRMFKPDIYRYVGSDGSIWKDPDNGSQLTRCPWLTKLPNQNTYSCEIYHDRPEDCRYYPTTIEEMIRDDCEMLEPSDRENPKQAQRILDQLMSDSRPAVK